MEVSIFSSDVVALRKVMACSVVKAVVFDTLLAAQRSIFCLLFLTGSLVNDVANLPELKSPGKRFPLDELHTVRKPEPENKDASDTEDDYEDGDDDDDDQDDDAGDEDFSGEEGGEDDDDANLQDDPAANGNGGSDDEDEEDEDGDDDEDGEDEDEEDEDEDEDEEDQPPAKKRK